MPIFQELITLSNELVAAVQRARPRAPRAAARRGVHAQRRRRRARPRGVPRGCVRPVRDRRVRLRGDRPGDLRRHRRARLPLPADRAARRPRPLARHARDGHLGAARRPLADRAPPRHDRLRLTRTRRCRTCCEPSRPGPRRGCVVGAPDARNFPQRAHEQKGSPEGDPFVSNLQLLSRRGPRRALQPGAESSRRLSRRLARLLALQAHPVAVRRPAGAQRGRHHRDAAGRADGRVVIHRGSMSPTDERGTHGTAPALT